MIAPAALPAAVPVLVTTRPSPPETRAAASAIAAAPASPRAVTKRIRPERWNASRMGILWMLITPKAVVTLQLSRNALTRSPTVPRGSDMIRLSSGDVERRAGNERGQRRCQEDQLPCQGVDRT